MSSPQLIQELIVSAIKKLNLPLSEFSLNHPVNETFGDYAANVALVLFPRLDSSLKSHYTNPHTLAEAISGEIKSTINDQSSIIKDVQIAGPGFINFYLSEKYLYKNAQSIIDNRFDKPLTGQKIAVEFTDPNPFKEFHIGHLYSNIIGESISRIYEANGATVWRCDFYGDTGLHVAKSVWGLLDIMNQEKLTLTQIETLSLKDRQSLLGQGYALGVNRYDQDETIKKEIEKINLLIYQSSKNEEQNLILQVYHAGLRWSLDYFETYYQRLGTKFDGYYPESKVGDIGLKTVEKGLEMKVLEIGENQAVVYKGEKDGLHTRVFRNQFGLPTYEAKDLGLVQAKYADFKFDLSLNIFGKEIDEYYKVVKKVMEQIIPELGTKQIYLAHGMVNLPSGKMSSRSGNVVTVEWLLNHARDLALKLIHNDSLSEDEKTRVAEQVGQAAIKYAFLMSSVGDNITFDFDTSVTFNGNSGPYLQYTFARCTSVLAKAIDFKKFTDLSKILLNPEEISLLRWFYRYPEVISQAATDLAPHLICTYLYELAKRFNTFYDSHSILGTPKKPLKPLITQNRLFLTQVTANILKQGLLLLGISAPIKM